jgi:hypothetical protein
VVDTIPVGFAPWGIAFGRASASVPSSGKTCNGTYNGTFKGNITVSTGQNCKFVGGGVTGDVQQNGGNLELQRSTVGGNVQITGGGTFTIGPGTVAHNLTIQNLPTGTAQNLVCGTLVRGDLQSHNNGTAVSIGAPSLCAGNSVGGNLDVHDNPAPVRVFGNTVGNNLQCQNNASIMGAGNTAKSKQAQCATF